MGQSYTSEVFTRYNILKVSKMFSSEESNRIVKAGSLASATKDEKLKYLNFGSILFTVYAVALFLILSVLVGIFVAFDQPKVGLFLFPLIIPAWFFMFVGDSLGKQEKTIKNGSKASFDNVKIIKLVVISIMISALTASPIIFGIAGLL